MQNYRNLIHGSLTAHAAINGIPIAEPDDAASRLCLFLQTSVSFHRLPAGQTNGKNPVSVRKTEVSAVWLMLCAGHGNYWPSQRLMRVSACSDELTARKNAD